MESKSNPLFKFMGIGSLIYAFFYTLFLYRNGSGITYPFFVGGTCLLFFLFLKRSGHTATKFSIFLTASLLLLGLSTCLTDSWVLHFFNKLGIFILFFYLMLHNFCADIEWGFGRYIGAFLSLAIESLCRIFYPFTDLIHYQKEHSPFKNKNRGTALHILYGILIALPLLIVILLLLGSADMVFYNLFMGHLIDLLDVVLSGDIIGILFLFLFAFFASYSIMSALREHTAEEMNHEKTAFNPITGITFTGLLSLVYLAFCMIQIIYLFAGLGTLPENYTYASYAREGFFQLVFVSIINLVLILVCVRIFAENMLLKGILTFISLCTYIMIASSAYRMVLYIQVYYLTFLRVFVLWALALIAVLMAGAIFSIYRKGFPLVKYCAIVTSILYLGFSFSQPDHYIASYNLDQGFSSASTDYSYLHQLSNDAAPVIFNKAEDLGFEYSGWFLSYAGNIPDRLTLREWNLSQWRAITCYSTFSKEHPAFQADISE